MDTTRKFARMSIALAILSLVAMCFSYVALNDIAYQEADLSMEWAVLRVTALIILMFVALATVTLRRVLRLK